MIDQFASSAAIAVLNRMLVREQWARDKLAPFAGRSARFDAAPFTLTLQVADGGMFAAADPSEPAVIDRHRPVFTAAGDARSKSRDERRPA